MLVPILRAAHCRSTHHFFAIDALERIGTESGRRLSELLLKHYARYLKGAKDPDDAFKDFQNHVIHVSQNNWGGAARTCQQWYERAMGHLHNRDWSEAAYACGVLSHYFTDPIMPLHTGQTPQESVVHRPMEWSICKAYEEIYAACQFKRATYQLKISDQDDWIGQAVVQCATIAHSHYHRLIEIYNLARGVADPPRGLTKEARQILADLFDLAMGGWAAILMRMAADLPALPPDCSLTMATVIAGIDMPRGFVLRKFSDAAQRAEVQRIFDEYTETGQVIDNLPAEQKVVRREFTKYLKEQESPRAGTDAAQPAADEAAKPSASTGLIPAAIPLASAPSADLEQAVDDDEPESREPDVDAFETDSPKVDAHADDSFGHDRKDTRSPATGVTYDSPLVDAPSIGPKTADRFAAIGIMTIGEFLDSEAQWLAEALATDWITQELIEDWQDQAALVCELDILCGYKAQLLVAVGCRTVDELADAQADRLHSMIAEFGRSKEGQRVLRKASIPDREEVLAWIQLAKASC